MASLDFKKNPKTKFKDGKKMGKKEAREEIEAIREGIEYHNYLYYVKNKPEISDGTYDRLFHRLQDLEKISEVGPEIAESVENFFKQKENKKVLDRLSKSGVEVEAMPARKELPLKGKTFVFSGSLNSYTRSEVKAKVESLGGRATSSVSGETDYVVAGENPGSKLNEAKKQKVKIIDEKKFRKLIGK
jgi:NAD-dependent DNA ligase